MGRGHWEDQKPNPDHKSGFTLFHPIMYVKTQPILIFDQISFGELCFRGYPFTPWSPMLWSFRLWPWQLSKYDVFDIPSENITFYFLKISDNSMLNQYLYFVYHSHFFWNICHNVEKTGCLYTFWFLRKLVPKLTISNIFSANSIYTIFKIVSQKWIQIPSKCKWKFKPNLNF